MPLKRLRWLILGLLFFSTVINYVDRQALAVLLPVLRLQLHLTSADYGAITTAFLLTYTACQLGAGMLIDRIGTRIGFSISVAIWSVAAMLHAFARGVVSLGLFRCLLGLGEAGNWPAGGKAISRWFPQEQRAFAMGVFDGGSAIGAVVAPPLVATLALKFGWQSAFLGTGTLGFAWLAAWWLVYRSPEHHPWLAPKDRGALPCRAEQAAPPVSAFAAPLLEIIGTRQLLGLMATRLFATPVWWFYVFWLPDYLSQDRHFSLMQIGLYAWIPYLAVDIGKLAGGATSDRLLALGCSPSVARKTVMIFGALAMAAAVRVVGAPSAASAIAWVCVATFGFGIWSANILALHADLFPSDRIASALGLTGMASSLGGAVFTFVIGQVINHAGYAPVFWVAGTTSLVACLALVFWLGPVKALNVLPGTDDEV